MGQGPQNNENAAEQFQDEQISDAIRRLVMSGTSYTNVADFDGRAKQRLQVNHRPRVLRQG